MEEKTLNEENNNLEKRSEERVNVLVTVYCEHAKRFIAAYSLDMSPNGIFVKTKEPFGQGDRVDMEFVLPECEEVLKAVGEVRWVVKNGVVHGLGQSKPPDYSGMGIEFVEISDRVTNNLRSYIEGITGEAWTGR